MHFCGQMSRNTLWVVFAPKNLTGNPVTATLNTTHAPSTPTVGQTQEVWQQTKTKSFSRPWIQRITLFYYYFFQVLRHSKGKKKKYIYIYTFLKKTSGLLLFTNTSFQQVIEEFKYNWKINLTGKRCTFFILLAWKQILDKLPINLKI